MWPRKQLDIGWRDFAFGLSQFVQIRRCPSDDVVVPADWISPDEALVSLSVRTGWDLLLNALRLPTGSEVIVSAVTIPDMVRIVEHHGLAAVPVDVDARTLKPVLEDLERAITQRTRIILVAHLFGSCVDMAPIIPLAELHDLLVVEDCAQAFVGRAYTGHPDSDCSLFSFGPIKTATALGGAVMRVRDPGLRARMADIQQGYPVQSRRAYFKRLAKYALFRLLLSPRAYGALVRVLRALGVDHDRAFSNAAHSFGASEFFSQLRQQPCAPLLHLLGRRINIFHHRGIERLDRRTARGRQLAAAFHPEMVVGGQNDSHTFWVAPLRVQNPATVVSALRRAGFDATSRSSLVVVPAHGRASGEERECAAWLAETVFLPNGDDMPDDEWNRMLSLAAEVARVVPPPRRGEPAAPRRVWVPS